MRVLGNFWLRFGDGEVGWVENLVIGLGCDKMDLWLVGLKGWLDEGLVG